MPILNVEHHIGINHVLENKTKSSIEKFYFYFEREHTSKSYSFVIIDKGIICEECNNKRCNHVFEIMSEPKIQEKITKQGIEFLPKYEKEIKELEKNVKALKEYGKINGKEDPKEGI